MITNRVLQLPGRRTTLVEPPFSCLTFDHLSPGMDEPSLKLKQPYVMRVWEGRWQKGVTAGGCRNFVDTTFHINPQFLLITAEDDEVVISVHQHVVLCPLVIGFSVYEVGFSFMISQKYGLNYAVTVTVHTLQYDCI